MTQQSIDLGTVLHFMRAALRERSAALQSGTSTVDVQYGGIVEPTLIRMGEAQIINLPSDLQYGSLEAKVSNRNPELSRLIVEAFHYLFHNGLITRPPDPPNFP